MRLMRKKCHMAKAELEISNDAERQRSFEPNLVIDAEYILGLGF